MTTPEELEALLAVQERDLALERLQLRRDTLAERGAVGAGDARAAELAQRISMLREQSDALGNEELRLDDEARSLAAQATTVDKKMYSGEISSPRELQAMQADIDQLQRRQHDLENRELELMEQREPIDAELVGLEARHEELVAELGVLREALAAQEAAVDAEMAQERDQRLTITAGIDAVLLADYERRRAQAQGVGVARLVGTTCQGCHLSIPATEVDRIRKAATGPVAHCDNCGCILVP